MRIASIDIGTNTALLLIADVEADGSIKLVHHEQRFPRIGKDVDQSRIIQYPAFERLRSVLLEYLPIISRFRAEKVIAGATSAVRDAVNKGELIEYILKETGITIRVLSGEEEARLTYLGAISGFPPSVNSYVVIDIGGGSTEISYYDTNGNFNKYSFQIGAVRLTERFFKHNPPTPEEIIRAKETIHQEFESRSLSYYSGKTARLIGVAGTPTTLACLDQNLMDFEVEKVSGYPFSAQTIQRWLDRLLVLTADEIRQLSNATEGRADILAAGALILSEFMRIYQFPSLIVSERGLRYGMAIEAIDDC